MSYQLNRYFDDSYLEEQKLPKFDCKNSVLTGALDAYLGDQLNRARAVLKNRTNEEISYGLESLDWLLKEGGRLESQLAIDILNRGEASEVFLSRPKALRLLKDVIDLSEQTSFQNATWAEYFALLTLINVIELFYALARRSIEPNTVFGKQLQQAREASVSRMTINNALEAMDAVAHAEGLLLVVQVASDRGRKGARLRVKKFDDLKRKAVKLYVSEMQEVSNRKASIAICSMMKAEIQAILNTDDPEITVAKWIGDYKLGRLKIDI